MEVEAVKGKIGERGRMRTVKDERRRGEQGGGGRGDSLTQGKEVAHRHAVCHLRATASSNDRSVPLLSRGYRRNDRVKDRARDSGERKKKNKEKKKEISSVEGRENVSFLRV